MDDFLYQVERSCKELDDLNKDFDKLKIDFLDATRMDEIPGAKLKHAMLGLFVGMYACAGEDPNSCGVDFVG